MSKVLKVKCPQCESEFNYYSSEYRPFCCERCKMIDLGHWFNENYSIASKENLSDSDIEKVIKHHEDGNIDEEN